MAGYPNGNAMRIEYDAIGDILYLDLEPPAEDQYESEIEAGVIIRREDGSGRIVGVEFQGLKALAASPDGATVRIGATFALDEESVHARAAG